jgi:hypothetical protein
MRTCISLLLTITVSAILFGCIHNEPVSHDLLSEFRPAPDAKITETGDAPILDAADGLPASE